MSTVSTERPIEAANAAYDKPTYQYYVLAMLVLGYVFNVIDRGVYGILLQSIKEEIQASDFAMGLLPEDASIGAAPEIDRPPANRGENQWTRRRLIALGAASPGFNERILQKVFRVCFTTGLLAGVEEETAGILVEPVVPGVGRRKRFHETVCIVSRRRKRRRSEVLSKISLLPAAVGRSGRFPVNRAFRGIGPRFRREQLFDDTRMFHPSAKLHLPNID